MEGTNFGAALADLPPLKAGTGEYSRKYDPRLREAALALNDQTRNYLVEVLEIDKAEKLTCHVARPHSERDLRDFTLLAEGENSATCSTIVNTFRLPVD